MLRMPLKQGETIQLNNRQYTIESVLGDGATCIVYSAYYNDNMGVGHRVNIKECYPFNCNITRDGQALVWESSNEKEIAFSSFRAAYQKLMMWQNNNVANAFDIYEENQTLYIVMKADEGVTFDKDSADNLGDILKTVKLLAYVVGNYHNNGYLHLDIKPSNFLVYPRPSEHIILFDMDTITAEADIKSGKIKCVSYSQSCAAPEQKQGKLNKLCPATDIFAIGAVLFEKIVGRSVESFDLGVFVDWEFDGELFENVNPKIKRLLRNIFKKTLSANISRRYKTTDKLMADLDEAIKVAESEVYLKGDDVCCSGRFIGREKELLLIKENFDAKKKAVFLHGFGGIGKTEIARRYAELHKKDYDAILFVKYDSNLTLQDKLDEIEIVNFDGDTIEHRRKLRTLLDNNTLIIVDNFDVEIGIDNTLKSLLDTKAHVLVSTRTDFTSVYSGDNYAIIEISELANKELEQIFLCNSKLATISVLDKEILNKIFKLIDNHTYATELLAKQMYYSGWSYNFLYEKLKSGFASLKDAEKIVINKDEDVKKDNSLNILRAIYNISNLTDGQKQVLRNIFMLRFMNITKENYTKYTFSANLEDVNTLIEIGLVQYDRLFCKLHPLLEELVSFDLNPNMANCKGVYTTLQLKISDTGHYDGYDDADEFEFEANCDFLCGFFKYANLNDGITRSMLINWLLDICGNENIRSGEGDDWRYSPLYEKLILLCDTEKTTPMEKYNIYYIVLLSWLITYSRFYVNAPEKTESHRNLVEQKVREFLPLAVSNCENLGEEKESYIEKLYDAVIYQLLNNYFNYLGESTSIVNYILRFCPQKFDKLTVSEKSRLGLPLSESESEELERDIPDVFKPGYTDEEIEIELNCKNNFRESEDKIAYFKQIINSSEYSPMKRAELLWYCTDSVFDRMHMGVFKNDKVAFDWDLLEELLDLEEDFLISDECEPIGHEEIDNWNHYVETNTVNQIIVYAATNNFECFETSMNLFLGELGDKIKWYLEHGTHWVRFISIRDHQTYSLTSIYNALESIKKSHLMLPTLLRYLEGWQEYATKIGQYDDRDFFSLYKTIVECAEIASCETIENPNYARDFSDIEFHYREKMDNIAGVDFTLKFEEES